jgi:hypothetical protein
MTNVYRLAPGTLTTAAIQANAAYIVENFPAPSGFHWYPNTMGLMNPGVARVRVWGRGVAEMGNTILSPWSMILPPEQTEYLEDTFFMGEPSTAVTIQTLNFYRDATWAVYNCYMVRPQLVQGNVVQKNNVGFPEFRLEFLPGTLAAAS